MTKNELLDSYKSGIKQIVKIAAEIPEGVMDFTPPGENAWTIRQHLIHIADSDINHFTRIKSCIAQPGSNVYVIDEENWVKNLNNRKEDVSKYIRTFTLIRELIYEFLNDLDEKQFHDNFFIRKYNGKTEKISLFEAVEIYAEHIPMHVEYIENIIQSFLK